jgi:hypothetical protein
LRSRTGRQGTREKPRLFPIRGAAREIEGAATDTSTDTLDPSAGLRLGVVEIKFARELQADACELVLA